MNYAKSRVRFSNKKCDLNHISIKFCIFITDKSSGDAKMYRLQE